MNETKYKIRGGGSRRRGLWVPLAAHYLAWFLVWLKPINPILRHLLEAVDERPGAADVLHLSRQPLHFLRRCSFFQSMLLTPFPKLIGAPALRWLLLGTPDEAGQGGEPMRAVASWGGGLEALPSGVLVLPGAAVQKRHCE